LLHWPSDHIIDEFCDFSTMTRCVAPILI
jgi:hypothetical protein